ncbi:MAG: EAL domain-containing protein [Rhodocyclaceae bacterium]|nr:EAL domain-containing protein [Rhodocyclaceae bacterium]
MPKAPIKPAAHAPGCDACAGEFGEILAKRTLQAAFRPVADFNRCEIFGYFAAVRGPAGMLHGSFGRMSRIARQLGLLDEFTRRAIETIVLRYLDSGIKGLLFVPIPPGAIEDGRHQLAEAIYDFVDGVACPPERIVVVVPSIDTGSFTVAVEFVGRLRSCGFRIASRSFGCELTEHRLWSLVPPDFVLLEEHLFEGVDLTTVCNTGLAGQLAGQMAKGRRIVADGIASSNDFNALQQLGIDYGAGDFIGRSNPLPTRAMSAAAHKAIAAACECGTGSQPTSGGVLERLLMRIAPVSPDASADEVFMLFEGSPELRAIAVVADGLPRGLISRYEMVDNMARPYRHELYGRKPCTRFMDPRPLVVDIGVSLQELAEIVVGADPRHLISGFIITDRGIYVGMGSVQDLVREVTSMQMEAAKYANPLTQLPGNVPINQHIDNLLAAGIACCIAYCDLDHFKPFNDVYGYAKGDEVIQLTARLLTEACNAECDFVGHIGGDDFVLVMRSDDWESRCKRVLAAFGEEILGFFSNDDIERGGYITENRKGEMEFHRLTALSIGAVEASAGMFQNHLQISIVAAEVKKRAKAMPGNSLFVNQRLYHNDAAPPADEPPQH